jgi:hypothetical protein
LQRKVLTLNEFACLAEVEDGLWRFERYHELATTFRWQFTR